MIPSRMMTIPVRSRHIQHSSSGNRQIPSAEDDDARTVCSVIQHIVRIFRQFPGERFRTQRTGV